MVSSFRLSSVIIAGLILASTSIAFAADGGDWTVSKSTGDVWLSATGLQQASLKQDDVLKPGQTISTGPSGRVLLKRGDETILISANSVVGLPTEKKDGLATTIVQRAGSILLDVEKRNVKHFEVETPYMAAVVKGTQFRVTVNAGKTTVDVVRGQVEVADFKSGQIAQVTAGQHATAFASGKLGLSLGGAGTLAPIEQGKPRAPSVERVPVPRNGLSTPRNAANERSLQPSRHGSAAATVRAAAGPGGVRISSPIGEVRLNVHRATNGLAREKSAPGGGRNAASKDTIWQSPNTASTENGSQSTSANASPGAAATSSPAATVAAAAGGNGNGNGKGNNGNGNGNGNGNANGNGKANGHGHGNGGNGNNGNGNGNNGNGNGNGHGRGKN